MSESDANSTSSRRTRNEVVVEFYVPDEPNTLNKIPGTAGAARMWRSRKNAWYEAAYYGAIRAFPGLGPSKRGLPPCDVFFSFPVSGERTRDPSNWTATTKPIVDAFVAVGFWPDDSPEWVIEHPVSFRVMRSKEQVMKSKVIVRMVGR